MFYFTNATLRQVLHQRLLLERLLHEQLLHERLLHEHIIPRYLLPVISTPASANRQLSISFKNIPIRQDPPKSSTQIAYAPSKMTSPVDIPVFEHDALPDPKTWIRLLKITSAAARGTRDFPIHCELVAFEVSVMPEYRAISYTWGPETPLFPILVNGQRLEVREHCEYMLRQVSQHVKSGYIWVDAICINQKDNDEKSVQVAQMGVVYKTAVQVFACVGEHADESDLLYGALLRSHRHFRWLASLFLSPTAKLLDDHIRVPIRHYPRMRAWNMIYNKSTLAGLYPRLRHFLERPYFHRVWIFQEIFLGRDVEVLCGGNKLPISWIWATCFVPMLWDSHKYLGFHLSYSIAYTDVRPRSLPILQAGSASNTQEPLPMHFVLDTICRLQCQDPRDRVYGVLSVVEWGDSEPMKPNYDLDVFDFALQFADYLRSSTGTTHNLWYILRKISQLADAMGFPHTLPPQLLATVQGHATQCVEDVTSQVGNPNATKQYRWWGIYLLYDGDN